MTTVLYLIIACGVLSIVYGVVTTRAVLAADAGSARMQEIAAAIRKALRPISRANTRRSPIVGVVIFFILAYLLGLPQAIGFAIGAVLSGAAGYHRHERLGARQCRARRRPRPRASARA